MCFVFKYKSLKTILKTREVRNSFCFCCCWRQPEKKEINYKPVISIANETQVKQL